MKEQTNYNAPCRDHLGKEYHSFQAMARAYGLSSVMLSKRLNQYGWDLEKALTAPLKGRKGNNKEDE